MRKNLFQNPDRRSVEGRVWRLYRWGQLAGDRKFLIAVTLCFAIAFLSHLLRHWTFGTTFFDMSFLNPPLFFPFGDVLFHCSVCRNGTQFAEHIVWSLVPFALITQFIQSDVLIFLFKALCLFLPVYYFVRSGPLKERKDVWLWVFVLLMLSTPFKANFTWDFREDHLAFALILFTALAMYRQKIFVAFLLIMATAATKENLPFSTVLWCIPLIFAKEIQLSKKQRYLWSALIAITSLVYLVLVNKVFIPHFMAGGESQNNILLRFPGVGNTMEEAIQNVIARPFHYLFLFLSRLSFAHTIKYLAFVLIPFVLGYRAWIWFVPALPQLAANLLVDHEQQRMMVNHYEVIILAFLFIALCFGISKTEKLKQDRAILCSLLLALCVAGRGPVVEISKRLVYKWYLIPPAIEMMAWEQKVIPPLTADAFTVTHFHRIKDIRILEIPQHVLMETEEGRLAAFVEMNPKRMSYDQAKDGSDAQTFLVNLSLLGGKWFEDLLFQMGGVELARTKDGRGRDFAVLIHMKKNPFVTLCEEKGICQVPWKR